MSKAAFDKIFEGLEEVLMIIQNKTTAEINADRIETIICKHNATYTLEPSYQDAKRLARKIVEAFPELRKE